MGGALGALEGDLKRKLGRTRLLYALLSGIGYGSAGILLVVNSGDNAPGWIVLFSVFVVFAVLGGYHHGVVLLAFTEYWKAKGVPVPLRAHWHGFTHTTDTSLLPPQAQFHQRCLRIANYVGLLPFLAVAAVGFALLRVHG